MTQIVRFVFVLLRVSILLQCCRSFSTTVPLRGGDNNYVGKNQACNMRISLIQSSHNDRTTDFVEAALIRKDNTPPLKQQETCQVQSRRTALCQPLIGILVGVITLQSGATSVHAASSKQVEEDKSKIYQGFVQLNYLLDHWEQETTICGRSGDNPYISKNGCERTPIKVMDYLGFKDITHPLFKADKTMRRLEPFVPTDREGEFYEAIESWMIAAEEGNGMAYISSWGEANPGGGKDRVQLFIERAKKNVMQARDSLSTMVDIFDLKDT